MNVKKIAVIGPESTGKSFLCAQLAAHYGTAWVREYAREYLREKGPSYTFEDLYKIAEGQLAEEDKAVGKAVGSGQPASVNKAVGNGQSASVRDSNKAVGSRQSASVRDSNKAVGSGQSAISDAAPLFIDTNLYVIKIWSEFVFNKCDNRILTEISKRKYDGYLLCNTDLPWVDDALREYPDLKVREKLFKFYKEELTEQKTPWAIISGGYEERFKKAAEATDKYLLLPY